MWCASSRLTLESRGWALHGLGNEASSAQSSVKYNTDSWFQEPGTVWSSFTYPRKGFCSPLAHTGDPSTSILRLRDRDGDEEGTSVHKATTQNPGHVGCLTIGTFRKYLHTPGGLFFLLHLLDGKQWVQKCSWTWASNKYLSSMM